MHSGSSIYALSNNITCSQTQIGATVPLTFYGCFNLTEVFSLLHGFPRFKYSPKTTVY
jgi:hypothetical protein